MTNQKKPIELLTIPASATALSQIQDQLISTINRGYNKPRFKYNVIETPRVKDSIFDDFGIHDPDNFHFAFIFAPSVSVVSEKPQFDSNDDGNTYTKKLIQTHPVGSLDIDPTNLQYSKSVERLQQLITQHQSNLEFQILGTVAIKSFNQVPGEFEITAFTSFYPGVSSYLLAFIDQFAKLELGASKLWVDVIEAHLLTDYYERFGFTLVKRIHCKVDPVTHLLVGDSLEDGVRASCDFNLVLMSKDL